MPHAYATRPFADELHRLLRERGVSQRALAADVGISQSHLSRLLRGADYRHRPSLDLAQRIAVALNLPPDFFVEAREAALIDAIRSDAGFREAAYRLLQKRG